MFTASQGRRSQGVRRRQGKPPGEERDAASGVLAAVNAANVAGGPVHWALQDRTIDLELEELVLGEAQLGQHLVGVLAVVGSAHEVGRRLVELDG